MDGLAQAAGHVDRNLPLRNYCTGLLLDGERKSVEPMAARLAPDHVQRMHESLHHFVAQSPWIDADMLRQVRSYVLPAMLKNGPVTAWIVDENQLRQEGYPFGWSGTAILWPVGEERELPGGGEFVGGYRERESAD